MTEYISNSYEETCAIARDMAKTLPKGTVIAFVGDLGAGKTAFTTGFAAGLGMTDCVTSPTFSICNVYRNAENTVYHFDMYRVESWDDLVTTGYFEVPEGAYMLIEWSENIYGALPEYALIVRIDKTGETGRKLTVMSKKEAEIEFGISD